MDPTGLQWRLLFFFGRNNTIIQPAQANPVLHTLDTLDTLVAAAVRQGLRSVMLSQKSKARAVE
jgi:hypothetical protein